MTTLSTSLPKCSISLRMAGSMVLVLALLFTFASYILQAKLNYPAILLDTASLANSLVAQGKVAVLLGFIGLLLCGVLLVGSEEALLSDSIRMADQLKAAGVEVKLEIWPGMWHDFVGSPDSIPEVRLATQHIAKFIRQHLGT